MLASQRIESVMDFTNDEPSVEEVSMPEKRGAAPTLIEMFILSWVSGKPVAAFY
jgi:transient receptor potential cation channel subfamily C member 4